MDIIRILEKTELHPSGGQKQRIAIAGALYKKQKY